MKRVLLISLAGFLAIGLCRHARAGDLRITISKRTQPTPVQRLNQEGVEAIRKRQYDKAKTLFYQAYLYDPGDPFTLNNLGFVSELEGQVERAKSFYALAADQATEAVVDRASSKEFQGESFRTVLSSVHDLPMQINRGNVEAVRLLSEGRGPEADLLLQRTLALDPHNGFTLNNLGVAKESEGEYREALKYYNEAAASHSDEIVVVTLNSAWRGKAVSEMASESAKRLRKHMETLESPEQQAALLNLRGVSAINRNDWYQAGQNFSQAYKLDPHSAFALNNIGFMAEMEGDLETAQEFYQEAQQADGSRDRVGLATRPMAEGMKLNDVADQSVGQVSNSIEARSEQKRRNPGPIQLKRRDNTPVVEPSTPPQQPEATPQAPTPPPQ